MASKRSYTTSRQFQRFFMWMAFVIAPLWAATGWLLLDLLDLGAYQLHFFAFTVVLVGVITFAASKRLNAPPEPR